MTLDIFTFIVLPKVNWKRLLFNDVKVTSGKVLSTTRVEVWGHEKIVFHPLGMADREGGVSYDVI